MSIATSVESYLSREGILYDTLHHAPTKDSMHSAQAAHIPGDRLAKCVLLEDDNGFLMAVVPATHKVDLGALHRALNRDLGLATDRALIELFRDCEPGAVPPLGSRLRHRHDHGRAPGRLPRYLFRGRRSSGAHSPAGPGVSRS